MVKPFPQSTAINLPRSSTWPAICSESIGRVLPFTSSDEARPTLQGAMLCLTPSTLMPTQRMGSPAPGSARTSQMGLRKPKHLLPAKFLRELLRLVGPDDQVDREGCGRKALHLSCEQHKRQGIDPNIPVVDGNFPLEGIKGLYAGESSSPTSTTANVSKAALSTAIRQVFCHGNAKICSCERLTVSCALPP